MLAVSGPLGIEREMFHMKKVSPMSLRLSPMILSALLLLPLPAALAQQGPATPTGIPGLARAQALDYPDKTQLSVTSSGFEYRLFIGGQHVEKDGDRTILNRARINASLTSIRDSNGLQRIDRITGTCYSRMTDEDNVSAGTTPFSYVKTDNIPGKAEGQKPITISKKLGVAHFAAPTWKVVNFPTTTSTVYRNKNGTFTDKLEQTACFDIRIPDQASTNTAFAAAVRQVEGQGHDQRMPLSGNVGPATFEVPWKGGSAHGTFVVPVEALVTPGWINVNTPMANRYMEVMSGRRVENPLQSQVYTGTLTITWWIGARPPKGKLVLEPDDEASYQQWLPTPEDEGGVNFETPGFFCEPLDIEARLEPENENAVQPLGKLEFTLSDVSTNAGRCCNFPKSFAADEDLRFAAEQSDPDVQVDPQNPRRAYTTKPVDSASVTIEALDTGAYGRLEVRCDDFGLVGEYEATGNQFIAIPRDDDGNHIADCWEKQRVGGQAHEAEWDEDAEPAGQANNGDGIILYREYRGFTILGDDGQRQFVRLDPKRKNLFVIDAGDIFDTRAWGAASGMLAYKLDDLLVRGGDDRTSSRIVDHNADEFSGHVYAIRVESVAGLADPEAGTDNGTLGYTMPWPIAQPRDATHCAVFPDRHRRAIASLRSYLQRAINNPQGKEGKALQAADMPPHLWQDAFDHLDAARQEQLAEQFVRTTAIHEVGHACALPGHCQIDENGDEVEAPVGDKTCPMRYSDHAEDLRWIILQTIFKPEAALQGTFSRFCKQDHNCWSKLSLRD